MYLMMMTNKITKTAIIVILGVSLWHSITTNNEYDNISSKLNVIIENSNKSKIDSLQLEIMEIGWKLDSMVLEHDYNFSFTN